MTEPQKPVVVAIVADMHTNSTVALCPPSVQLDDGGTYYQSPAQRWIWRSWLDFWRQVDDIDRAGLVVVLNGDLVEGNHHSSTQLVTSNETIQQRMALEVLQPVADRADHLFVIRGTEAHTGPSAQCEEAIARELGAEPEAEGVYSWWHLPLTVKGTTFDISHHPQTSGRRPWTRDQSAARQAAITWAEYHEIGLQPPDICVRSHVHYFARGYSRETLGIFLSPWQLSTSFGRRLGAGRRIEPLGGVIVECQDQSYSWRTVQYKPRERQTWTLPTVS